MGLKRWGRSAGGVEEGKKKEKKKEQLLPPRKKGEDDGEKQGPGRGSGSWQRGGRAGTSRRRCRRRQGRRSGRSGAGAAVPAPADAPGAAPAAAPRPSPPPPPPGGRLAEGFPTPLPAAGPGQPVRRDGVSGAAGPSRHRHRHRHRHLPCPAPRGRLRCCPVCRGERCPGPGWPRARSSKGGLRANPAPRGASRAGRRQPPPAGGPGGGGGEGRGAPGSTGHEGRTPAGVAALAPGGSGPSPRAGPRVESFPGVTSHIRQEPAPRESERKGRRAPPGTAEPRRLPCPALPPPPPPPPPPPQVGAGPRPGAERAALRCAARPAGGGELPRPGRERGGSGEPGARTPRLSGTAAPPRAPHAPSRPPGG
ncbi:proline-rich protein HaeIII subfamily 1-like [Haliaeetus albicilla]|uniref:proline-rich protein HaeIII subfamily 1-like n=1 Tax=Haliaeetus albicilla TaxID=8969 RepID=UPI0037E87440